MTLLNVVVVVYVGHCLVRSSPDARQPDPELRSLSAWLDSICAVSYD